MLTYITLNFVFLAVIMLALWFFKVKLISKRVLLTIVILCVMTAIFDSLIVGLGIVDYNYAKTLGVAIGTAPIEDFFYAILAGIMIPALWIITGRKNDRKS